MANTNQIIRSANEAVIVIGGKTYGLMTSVRFDSDFGVQEQYGIGDINPVENLPTAGRYTVTTARILLKTDQMVADGIIPASSGDVLTGLVFDILVIDKDGAVLQKARGCTFASGSVDVSANRAITGNATFKALAIEAG